MPKKILIALLAGVLSLGTVPVYAGLSEQEKALWGASAQAPTTFALPAGQDTAVMAKAIDIINSWSTRDRYMAPMHIHTSTTALIQTDDPTALNLFGFKITDTRTQDGAVIAVDTMAFEGKAFQVSQQHRDATKRAHLLAYLLEQYAGVPTTAAPPVALPSTALAPVNGAASENSVRDSFEPYLRRLRTQLAGGQYDDALNTLDGLRAAVADKAKAAPPPSTGK